MPISPKGRARFGLFTLGASPAFTPLCKFLLSHPPPRSPSPSPSESADFQIKGVPNQQYRRKASKAEAMAFYQAQYEEGLVVKYIENIAD